MERSNTSPQAAALIPVSTGDETLIVSVAGEGGGVRLMGRRDPESHWEFRRITNDSSWSMLEEDELNPNPPPPVVTWVPTWSEAVALLDRYPWAELHPLAVHPEFQAEVLVEVTRRLLAVSPRRRNKRMAQWLSVCSTEPQLLAGPP